MISTAEDLLEALALMHEYGGDFLNIEAKTMTEYSSSALGPTMSAFANLPGGGSILLGIDERLSNPIVGVSDPHSFASRATDQGRKGFSSPLTIDTQIIPIGNASIVCLNIADAPTNDKPVYFRANKTAYIRQFDGDYAMSPQEEQQLLLRHKRPRNDLLPVPGTSVKDLDSRLLASFITSIRTESNVFTYSADEEILRNLNIVTDSGELTRAGLYAMGTYPQRYLPTLSLTAAIEPRSESGDDRAYQRKDFNGPLPQILDDATQWVIDNTSTALSVDSHGHGTITYRFPPVAIREVIANALVHRDMSEPALGRAVELRLNDKGLRITSPGGLWGLSVETLRSGRGKSAVNEHLYTIARHVYGPRGRVIEALGSGIAAMQRTLRQADLHEPQFFDNAVSFTVIFPRSGTHSSTELVWLATFADHAFNKRQREALLDMKRGLTYSNARYRERFGVDSSVARAELGALVDAGCVIRTGERRSTQYSLADNTPTEPSN